MESKTRTNVCSARSFNRALALFVALGMVTSAASLFAKDNDDKDKLQSRDVNPAAHEQEDLNAKTDPEKFIRSVSYSWANEIRVGNLAKQRAQSQEVKEFAEKIVQDHTKANNELKRIAQQKNITLGSDVTAGTTTPANPNPARIEAAGTPATPGTPRDSVADVGTPRGAGTRDLAAGAKAHYQQVYDRMSSLSGKPFDDAFTTHMVQSHTRSVAKFEKASSDLDAGELKQFVESTLPTLREHLAMAQKIAPPDANRLNVREQTGKDSDYKKDQDKPKQDQDKPNK
jgi:putative membrane protein